MADDQQAMLRFCAAQQELAHIDDATAVERRQHTRGVSTFRELLKEQMMSARATCVPVLIGGQQKYAVLKPASTGTGNAVTCDGVMRTLRDLRYDPASATSTLEEWAEAALHRVFAGGEAHPRDAGGDRPPPRLRLSIVAKPPDGPPPTPVHPSAASRIHETVQSLHTASEATRSLRRRDEAKRKQLKAVCKETEERVAQHLHRHDPEHGTRRIRLVQGTGNEATCYLRRKQSQRTSKPTVRTALPAVRQAIRLLREEANVDSSLTWDTFRWLTSPATLAKLERHVSERLDAMHATQTKTRVVLTNVA